MSTTETHIKKYFSSDEMKKWVPDNQILNTFSEEIKLYAFFRKDLKLDDNRAKVFTEILYESIENGYTKNNTQYKSELQSDLKKNGNAIEKQYAANGNVIKS